MVSTVGLQKQLFIWKQKNGGIERIENEAKKKEQYRLKYKMIRNEDKMPMEQTLYEGVKKVWDQEENK